MSQTICRCNPHAEALLLCPRCQDTKRVTTNDQQDGSVSCPLCGDQDKLFARLREKNRRTLPTVLRQDLSDDEEAQVKEWRARGFHELDCLRWIEGRRYDPTKDREFLVECAKHLKQAHFLHEQPDLPVALPEIEAAIHALTEFVNTLTQPQPPVGPVAR